MQIQLISHYQHHKMIYFGHNRNMVVMVFHFIQVQHRPWSMFMKLFRIRTRKKIVPKVAIQHRLERIIKTRKLSMKLSFKQYLHFFPFSSLLPSLFVFIMTVLDSERMSKNHIYIIGISSLSLSISHLHACMSVSVNCVHFDVVMIVSV